jgi:hypothetical protein
MYYIKVEDKDTLDRLAELKNKLDYSGYLPFNLPQYVRFSSDEKETGYAFKVKEGLRNYPELTEVFSVKELESKLTMNTKERDLVVNHQRNPILVNAIHAIAIQAGWIVKTSVEGELKTGFNCLQFNRSDKLLWRSGLAFYQNRPELYEIVTIDELAKRLRKPTQIEEIVVKLNDAHNAIVTKNSIKVGCQTFSTNIIEKLAEARKQLE